MTYIHGNPKTKKLLKTWLKEGVRPRVFQPGPFGPAVKDGVVAVEGPHYPQPHTWYAQVEVRDGEVVRVVS